MTILECNHISCYFGRLSAVREVSFSLERGEVLGMIGPNGAGKTTLFNCITGISKPSTGSVILEGADITGLKPHRICRRGLARTAQIMEPFKNMTVRENVLVAAMHGGQMPIRKAQAESERIVEFVGLSGRIDNSSNSLTITERRRLELARAVATQAKVLLLDENMAGLNPNEIDQALELLNQLRQTETSLIVVEHIMAAIIKISDRVIVLSYGEKIAEGSPGMVVKDKRVIQAYLGEKFEPQREIQEI
jgi:branched-chain amino acid transport system ATP-binding protein